MKSISFPQNKIYEELINSQKKKSQFNTLDKFILQDKIGSGSFGKVYKVKYKTKSPKIH